MTLEAHFHEVLGHLLAESPNRAISKEQLIHTMDLTLLDETASVSELAQLDDAARTHHVAARCILMSQLNQFQQLKDISLATVVNFPQGNDTLTTVLDHIEHAIKLGANEIDYVLPYPIYLTGNKQGQITETGQMRIMEDSNTE